MLRILYNKPGTAQVGAISKAQKDSKTKTTFGKCALMHKKWTFRVELTKEKLATVRVGIFFENAD